MSLMDLWEVYRSMMGKCSMKMESYCWEERNSDDAKY